jgi:hypothetical protein
MQIKIKVDDASVRAQLKELNSERQAPFILSRSLNLLAKRVQENLRLNIENSLNLRRRSWVLRQVKINSGQWATKTRLSVTIELTEAARFISAFETGAQHLPLLGKKYLAIPNKEVFNNSIITSKNPLYIKNLQFHSTPFGTEGALRTFILNPKSGADPLILQRVAPGTKGKKARGVKDSGLRMLYRLVKASHRPRKIKWYDTANSTVVREQYGIFSTVIKDALANTKHTTK